MVPMNLYLPGKPVDVLHTGSWTAKAMEELKKITPHRLAASTKPEISRACREQTKSRSRRMLPTSTCARTTRSKARSGTRFRKRAKCRSSRTCLRTFFSRPIDVKRFGLIFAGAQKNLGPSGVTVVIVRKDLAERAERQNRQHSAISHARSKRIRSINTPPTFAVYVLGLCSIGSKRKAEPRDRKDQ